MSCNSDERALNIQHRKKIASATFLYSLSENSLDTVFLKMKAENRKKDINDGKK